MKRRELVRALPGVALLSGCLTRANANNRPEKRVSVTHVDDVEVTPAMFSMRVRHPISTDRRPPVLEFVNENPTSETLSVHHGMPSNGDCPVFLSGTDSRELAVAHESIYGEVDIPDDVWRLPRSGTYLTGLLALPGYQVPPDTTKVVPVGVFGWWENDPDVGIPPGTHTFEETLHLNPSDHQQRHEVKWRVTVDVSTP